MTSIPVMFFGPARDFGGQDSAQVELTDGLTVAELRAILGKRFPKLAARMPTMRLAVNEEFVPDDRRLHGGDTAALIAPVSGG
jgi:molybdopterin converting factor small subunit